VAKGNGRFRRGDPASFFTPQEKKFMLACVQAEEAGILSDRAREICRLLMKKFEHESKFDLGGSDE
jgi:hypothetical protein